MMRQRYGLLTKALPTLVLLLLVLSGVRAQDDEGIQNRQDFETNFGGPPLGDNGFVGANSLPRPQGLIDLGSFGDDAFAPSDVFQDVEQTFNQGNQLTYESATFQPSAPHNDLRKHVSSLSPESATFQPSAPSNDLSKHVSSLSTHSSEGDNHLGGINGFHESSGFKVFHGSSENQASSVEGSVPNDVLTINLEESQHSLRPQGVQGSHHLRRPGHNKRRPSGPLRRPIRQNFRGRPRQKPNNLRRDQPSYLTLLLG